MDWLEVNGACLRYEVSGSGPQTLVLIHELGGGLESWDEVLPTLQSNFQVIRYDQRGAGLSEKTSLLTVDIVLDDLRGLLDGLAVGDPVLLAGAALGGGYALAFAARDPERVARVVATSPATGVTDEAGKGLRERAELAETAGMRAAVESSLALSYRRACDRIFPDTTVTGLAG